MKFTHAALFSCLVGAAALAGCAVQTPANSASIGPAGGTLSGSTGALRGAQLSVPAGALASPVVLTMSEGAAPTAIPSDVESAGGVVLMGPEGQTFATMVTLTIPTMGAADGLLTRPLGASAWTVVEGASFDSERGAMVARVNHFSEFVPIRRRACAMDSSCPAGARCVAGRCAAPSTDAGASDASADASPACAADRDCPAGQRCAAGACVSGSGCPAGSVPCAGVCADLASDARNCGACGSACAAGQRCAAGVCSGSTPDAGAGDSSLSCAADRDCPAGQRCSAGACVAGGACVPSPERCNGLDDDCDGLVDESDPMSAGLCAAGQTCRMGACVSSGGCPAGSVPCAGVCADLASDARNCGACGSACAAGQRCAAGVCR